MRPLQVLAGGLLALSALFCAPCRAQTSVPVVMLSDIHFDPFHDPAKLVQLRAEPIDRWPAILHVAPSPTDAANLASLQSSCHAPALDTAWPLLESALRAAHDAEPRPLFVTLSGDLLTHDFPCRFFRLAPGASPADLAAFSAKTVAFVLAQLRQTFPRAPVYASLGNNDSGCGDYRATPNDLFQQQIAATLRAASLNPALAVTPEGDYSIPLPAPMQRTRLVVFQDIFESRQFATCNGDTDRTAERIQMDWLRSQLTDARNRHEHVWLMSHIPPGIDVYNSYRRFLLRPGGMCAAKPRPFLADTSLSDTLLDYADVVRLALFGHTHMDEIRLLHRSASLPDRSPQPNTLLPDSPPSQSQLDGSELQGPAVQTARSTGLPAAEPTIPAKLVPSVTPYLGNHPAFLVAQADPRTAVLNDWRTFVSPGPEGSTPPWTEAYRYTAAFHLPDFSAVSALRLADAFVADRTSQSVAASTFRQHFYPGDIGIYALGLAQIWPAVACSVREDHPSAVQSCVCAMLPAPRSNQP